MKPIFCPSQPYDRVFVLSPDPLAERRFIVNPNTITAMSTSQRERLHRESPSTARQRRFEQTWDGGQQHSARPPIIATRMFAALPHVTAYQLTVESAIPGIATQSRPIAVDASDQYVY